MDRWAERLLDRLDAATTRQWPHFDVDLTTEIGKWIAFRESLRETLKEYHGFTDSDRRYRVDPLPRRISRAFSSLIFGEAPQFEAANAADQTKLDDLVRENRATSKLQRGVITSSSEGEVWWRILSDPEAADVPLVEWHSRTSVIPMFRAERLKAVAFVTRYDEDDDENDVFRHFEVHGVGSVANVLYRGRGDRLGGSVPLDSYEETERLDEEWEHGLPMMLAGWIPNLESIDPTRGVSDYDGVEDFLFDLNEALSIGAENMRLTAKKRMTVPASAVDEHGDWRADTEIIPIDPEEEAMGEGRGARGYTTLEFGFDAEALIRYRRALTEEALGRLGINVQYVGAAAEGEGLAVSGTALRMRLLPTTAAGDERAQYWDDELPRIWTAVQMVDALPIDAGGFGRGWQRDGQDPPSIERGATLPEDPVEEAGRHATLTGSKIEGRRTAVEELHPDWDEDRVKEEMDRIRQDAADDQSAGFGSLFGDGFGPGSSNGSAEDESGGTDEGSEAEEDELEEELSEAS